MRWIAVGRRRYRPDSRERLSMRVLFSCRLFGLLGSCDDSVYTYPGKVALPDPWPAARPGALPPDEPESSHRARLGQPDGAALVPVGDHRPPGVTPRSG